MEVSCVKRSAAKKSEERRMTNSLHGHELNGARTIAAFFDLDGTLMALPSLERRFFETLRYQRAIPLSNYWRWFGEALRLAPCGIEQAMKANKMYLRGVANKRAGAGWFYTPTFFKEAIARAEWHAKAGHTLVIVSGTLEPLAKCAARALEVELGVRGVSPADRAIQVCATRLEEISGAWTGRIVGEAMFAEAKARAVGLLAGQMQLELAQCFAYGDSADDRWLLKTVGKPAAVNPTAELKQIAVDCGWDSLDWRSKGISTQTSPRSHRKDEKENTAISPTSTNSYTIGESRAKTAKARANR
jgi:HAD superfamily hydrolase (TIGR01490 family)